MNSIRVGTALLALLALSGCYRSAVSVVADADLVRVPGLADGRYCLAELDWDGAVAVDADDCRLLEWREDARIYAERRDWADADIAVEHEVSRLADDLYLSQVFEPDDAYPYTLIAFAPGLDSFAVIGDVRGDGLGVFADAYADVASDDADRFAAGRIQAGEPERIRALIELAARDDMAAWIEGGGVSDQVAIYVRLEADDGPSAAARRYLAAVDGLKARFVRLRR